MQHFAYTAASGPQALSPRCSLASCRLSVGGPSGAEPAIQLLVRLWALTARCVHSLPVVRIFDRRSIRHSRNTPGRSAEAKIY